MLDIDGILESTRLPTLPSVAIKLLELSKDPESAIVDYTRVIRSDPAISAKIVKAANSSYFGLASEVTSLEAAVPLLGSTVVTSLALSFSLISETHPGQHYQKYFQAFWSRSLLQAVTAESISTRYRLGNPPQCFLCGLLCDIGVLAHLCVAPDEYSRLLDAAENANSSILDLERAAFGFDHVALGCRLMESWRMPQILVEAARQHHAAPDTIDKSISSDRVQLIQTVQFATTSGEFLSRQGDAEVHDRLRRLGSLLMGLGDDELTPMLDRMRDLTDEAAKIMSINTTQLPRPSEILGNANARLAEIAIREHAARFEVSVKSAALELENRHLRERNHVLNHRADADSLTGLHNRGAFDEEIVEALAECLQQQENIGVIFCDLDRFKGLNDTYGHKFGDEVLRRTSQILKAQVRDTDFVARYGGEEFVVITKKCPRTIIESIAERIRQHIQDEVFTIEGKQVHATVSVGACVGTFCLLSPTDLGGLADFLVQQADQAMYDCKRNGRNQTRVVTIDHQLVRSFEKALCGSKSASSNSLELDASSHPRA